MFQRRCNALFLFKMRNFFRRKVRIPVYIVIFLIILIILLFGVHIRHLHHKQIMLNRFLSYEKFLHEIMSNVDELNQKINDSSYSIRKLSNMFPVPLSFRTEENIQLN